MTGLRNVSAMMLAAALVACSGQAAEQQASPETPAATGETHPISGLQIIPVTVTTDEGTHVFRSEVADTREAKQRGMMFRNEMGPDEGMLFPYEDPEIMSFWMRNTVLPLDIIFIDEDGVITNIADGVPYNEESVYSEREAVAVLGLIGGRSEELGIEAGDRVTW